MFYRISLKYFQIEEMRGDGERTASVRSVVDFSLPLLSGRDWISGE